MKTRHEHLSVIASVRPCVDASEHADGDALATALASRVAADLRRAISERGLAKLALSGGSTPLRFLQALSREALDWSCVRVLPVDDRWLPPVHKRSNERLLRECLLQNEAAAAQLLPLYRPVATPERALQSVMTQVILQALPLDVVVLGMGEEGHVASLFPDLGAFDKSRRDIGLQPSGRAPLMAVRSSAAPEPRMTLTLSAIFSAPSIYLHIEGETKRRVLESALDDPRCRLPIRALLAQAPSPVMLFWCPDARDAAIPNLHSHPAAYSGRESHSATSPARVAAPSPARATPSAPSPACAGRLGWGQAARELSNPEASTPALPRKQGRE